MSTFSIYSYGKVKFTLEQAMKAHRGSRDVAVLSLSLTSALDRGGRLTSRLGRFTPGKNTPYPLHRKLCGSLGRCGQAWNITPPPPPRVFFVVSCTLYLFFVLIVLHFVCLYLRRTTPTPMSTTGFEPGTPARDRP